MYLELISSVIQTYSPLQINPSNSLNRWFQFSFSLIYRLYRIYIGYCAFSFSISPTHTPGLFPFLPFSISFFPSLTLKSQSGISPWGTTLSFFFREFLIKRLLLLGPWCEYWSTQARSPSRTDLTCKTKTGRNERKTHMQLNYRTWRGYGLRNHECVI